MTQARAGEGRGRYVRGGVALQGPGARMVRRALQDAPGPKVIRITPAGFRESHVHDVAITKESPNYRSGN